MKTIGIASKNPVKAAAIRGAFEQLFPGEDFEVATADVESGVADQPMSDDETRRGAANRLAAVRTALPTCDFWGAAEGGIDVDGGAMIAMAWILVASAEKQGAARTATFPLPDSLARLVLDGVELGHACDRVFGKENCKHQEGAIGLLSHNVIDRQALYQHAAVMAILPLRNPQWF